MSPGKREQDPLPNCTYWQKAESLKGDFAEDELIDKVGGSSCWRRINWQSGRRRGDTLKKNLQFTVRRSAETADSSPKNGRFYKTPPPPHLGEFSFLLGVPHPLFGIVTHPSFLSSLANAFIPSRSGPAAANWPEASPAISLWLRRSTCCALIQGEFVEWIFELYCIWKNVVYATNLWSFLFSKGILDTCCSCGE